jgi:hypothetical protein
MIVEMAYSVFFDPQYASYFPKVSDGGIKCLVFGYAYRKGIDDIVLVYDGGFVFPNSPFQIYFAFIAIVINNQRLGAELLIGVLPLWATVIERPRILCFANAANHENHEYDTSFFHLR